MGYKVLFITFWYPTADNPVNGTFIREHARAIRAQGHETVILHFNIVYDRKLFSKVEQTETLPEGRIYRFEIRSRYYKWFYHAYPLLKQIALRIYGSLSKERFIPDIIHSNVVFPSGVIGYYLGKRFRIPAVMTEHWSGFKSFCGHPLFGRISRRAVGYHSKILPVSDYLAGIIRNYKPEAGAVRVVPNIVDQNIYTLKPPRQTDNKLVFTAVANWQARKVPAKRPDIIFGALKAFAESSQKKIILNIVGEGSTLRIYQESRDSYPFECVFHGYLDKERINKLLHTTDFFLHASNFETFSVVTLEALMTGTPVIVSDLPALRELVTPECGILVKNDMPAWLKAIQNAASRNWDSVKIAATTKDNFDYHSVGNKITEIYRQVLNNIGKK